MGRQNVAHIFIKSFEGIKTCHNLRILGSSRPEMDDDSDRHSETFSFLELKKIVL